MNVDNKRTAGLVLGCHDTYCDGAPGDVYTITTALYYRRYFHLGKRKICAFYVDVYVAAGRVYKVDGIYNTDYATGERGMVIDDEPGDALCSLPVCSPVSEYASIATCISSSLPQLQRTA